MADLTTAVEAGALKITGERRIGLRHVRDEARRVRRELGLADR
jgi:hypothetical protein